jgi:hypothetical protein
MGLLGGALLVVANSTIGSGKQILLPYALLLILVAAITRAERIASHVARFVVLLATFVLSTGCLYVVIALSPASSSLPLLGHVWRLAFVVGLGALLALPLARVTEAPDRSPAH